MGAREASRVDFCSGIDDGRGFRADIWLKVEIQYDLGCGG